MRTQMHRIRTITATLFFVVAIMVAPMGAVAETTTPTPTASTPTPNETASETPGDETPFSIAPGARLAAVVGVQERELSSDVASKALEHRLQHANASEKQAAVIAESLEATKGRMRALQAQNRTLYRQWQQGKISNDTYHGKMTVLAAEIQTMQERLNTTETHASQLPEDVRESHGINVTAIDRLKTDARNMTGPETAAVARSIAGNDMGRSPGHASEDRRDDNPGNSDRGRDGDRGRPDHAGKDDDSDDDHPGNHTADEADDDTPTHEEPDSEEATNTHTEDSSHEGDDDDGTEADDHENDEDHEREPAHGPPDNAGNEHAANDAP